MGLKTVVINALSEHVNNLTFPVFSFVFIHSNPNVSWKRVDNIDDFSGEKCL